MHNWNHAVWNFHDQTDFERAAARVSFPVHQYTRERIRTLTILPERPRLLTNTHPRRVRIPRPEKLGARQCVFSTFTVFSLTVRSCRTHHPVQILLDIVQSGGVIGGPHLSPKQQVENPIELVFCNPDLIWKSDFARPRIGQGAFREAFQAVYKVCSDYFSRGGACGTVDLP